MPASIRIGYDEVVEALLNSIVEREVKKEQTAEDETRNPARPRPRPPLPQSNED